jgi:two-component system response regulator YesN
MEFNEIKKQLEENYAYMREKFLVEMLSSGSNIDNLTEKLKYFYKDAVPSYYQAGLMETSQLEQVKEASEENRVLLGLESMNIVKQYFNEKKNVEVFFDNSRRIVIISNTMDIDLSLCSEQLKVIIINRVPCHVSIGIGNGYKDSKLISRTYKEALDALKYCIVSGRNQVASFKDDMNLSSKQWDLKAEEIKGVGFLVKAGLNEKAEGAVENIFSQITNSRNITIEQVRVISINMVSAVLGAINEMGLSYKDIYGMEGLPYNKIFEIHTLTGMEEYLKDFILETITSVKSHRTRKGKKITVDIIDYIKENLADYDLTLAGVANKFYLNPSYLSRIFKQETGQSFSEYLSRLRMEKATELLKETEMKGYQVAEAIGIKDPYYFSNCFKKFTGMSVNDYKKIKE